MEVMLDLETLGTRPNAIVLSIGAVAFEQSGIKDEVHLSLEPYDQEARGCVCDAKTALWWMAQDEHTINSVLYPNIQMSPREALASFSFWLEMLHPTAVWGNGSDFDNAILSNLYRAYGISVPWRYQQNACYRTAKQLLGRQVAEPEFHGVQHNALHDARHQANYLRMMRECLKSNS